MVHSYSLPSPSPCFNSDDLHMAGSIPWLPSSFIPVLTMGLGSRWTVDNALWGNICLGVFLKHFLHSQAETQSETQSASSIKHCCFENNSSHIVTESRTWGLEGGRTSNVELLGWRPRHHPTLLLISWGTVNPYCLHCPEFSVGMERWLSH